MATPLLQRPVLVGIDGSAESSLAAGWAVGEAERRHVPLVAILVWSYIDQPQEGFDPGFTERDADAALEQFLASAVGERAAGIERRVVCDRPSRGILDAAGDAQLVVVGARGAGGFAGLRLGSVADRVAQAAPVPAVVVCGTGDRHGHVVVGYDGSPTSAEALTWAADAALARGVSLEIVRAWEPPIATGWAFLPDAPIFERVRVEAEAETTDAASRLPAELDVVTTIREGAAARHLLTSAEAATLLVVGRRGVGGLAALALGSVSRQVVHHAACPVAVVPPVD